MSGALRRLAAVLAVMALVAALPAPCGCEPQPAMAGHPDEHACCAAPPGVSAADQGCCDEAPDIGEAVSPSGHAPAAVRVAAFALCVDAPCVPGSSAPSSIRPASSPPPTVLRI